MGVLLNKLYEERGIPVEKNQALDRLFEEWCSFYESNQIDSSKFSKDGIIEEQLFERATPKILFILREPNNFPGGDLRDLLRRELKYPIWHRVARWAYGCLRNFAPLDEEEIHQALQQTAVMNLKKISGGSTIVGNELETAVRRDRDFLRREVEIIDPQVIVSGGERRNIAWLLDLGDVYREDKHEFWWERANGSERLFLFAPHHPAERDTTNTDDYSRLKELWHKAQAEKLSTH